MVGGRDGELIRMLGDKFGGKVGFQESGMTDDELDALVEKAREDFHRERLIEDE